MDKTYKTIRKFAVAIVGSIVVTFGLILLVLPGPGLLVLVLGLAILSTEFEFAERQMNKLKSRTKELFNKQKNR